MKTRINEQRRARVLDGKWMCWLAASTLLTTTCFATYFEDFESTGVANGASINGYDSWSVSAPDGTAVINPTSPIDGLKDLQMNGVGYNVIATKPFDASELNGIVGNTNNLFTMSTKFSISVGRDFFFILEGQSGSGANANFGFFGSTAGANKFGWGTPATGTASSTSPGLFTAGDIYKFDLRFNSSGSLTGADDGTGTLLNGNEAHFRVLNNDGTLFWDGGKKILSGGGIGFLGGPSSLEVIDATGGSGFVDNISMVPEPTSAMLLLLAVGCMILRRR